jgi:hypothetical protein
MDDLPTSGSLKAADWPWIVQHWSGFYTRNVKERMIIIEY